MVRRTSKGESVRICQNVAGRLVTATLNARLRVRPVRRPVQPTTRDRPGRRLTRRGCHTAQKSREAFVKRRVPVGPLHQHTSRDKYSEQERPAYGRWHGPAERFQPPTVYNIDSIKRKAREPQKQQPTLYLMGRKEHAQEGEIAQHCDNQKDDNERTS